MRCLIYAKSSDAAWVRDYFPGIEPYLLKIVNKPVMEYYIDYTVLLKVKEIRIVSDTSIKEIEDWFKTGEKWGLNISYSLARTEDTIQQVYLKNYSFCKEDNLFIMQGFNFVEYDKNAMQEMQACQIEEGTYFNDSLIYMNKGTTLNKLTAKEFAPDCTSGFSKITSIPEYFSLCMDILLNKNSRYVLPGYSNEKDAFYGINFIFPHSSKAAKPIMIGNNVRFQEHTAVGPNAIVGDNVIIDEGTTICDSIIYDNSYVGCELELQNKIVYKNLLINGLSGDCVQITDNFLISQVDKGIILSYFDRILQQLIAIVLLILQVVPWMLIYTVIALLTSKEKRRSEYFVNKNFQTLWLDDVEKLKATFWGKIYLRLSLDKFPLLLLIFRDKLILVGNHVFSVNNHHRKLIKDLPLYQPGVFSLSESMDKKSEDVEEFVELEYLDTRCWRMNLKILVIVFFRRLIYGES